MVLLKNISLTPKTGKVKRLAILIVCSSVFLFANCGEKKKSGDKDFYKNLYTNEILTRPEFDELAAKLNSHYSDSLNEPVSLNFYFYSRKT
ncbi:MAG: hypothetical protein LBT50_02080, partial [Prevotellaceae bacterium]|nr:hypothetical protein [Prevotellaceae bacterium]